MGGSKQEEQHPTPHQCHLVRRKDMSTYNLPFNS